tara:strand:- start:462 stop:1247 length:786 start_codon:yes stop_codon:yes gene_type:complete
MLGQGLGVIAPWSTKIWAGGIPSGGGRRTWGKLTNITSDENSGGESQSTSSGTRTAGTLANGDKINAWNGSSGDINFVQTTSADKPTFDASAVAGPKFDGNQFMDTNSNITIASDSDFAIVVRFKCTNFDATRSIMGHDSNNVVALINNKTIRAEIAGTARQFAEASNTLAADQFYTLIMTRVSDTISAYIKGGAYTSEEQWGSSIASASGALTISNLGASSDDTNNFIGFIQSVLVYTTSAVGLDSASNRTNMFSYVENN